MLNSIKMSDNQNIIKITLKNKAGKVFKLQMPSNSKINHVKWTVEHRRGIRKNEQQITYKG